jgi:5-methylcytosine-specific restriction protein A
MCAVRVTDDNGRVLDAEYSVESDGSHLALVVASAGGGTGSRPPRNPDYGTVLATLLSRLRDLGAVLVDAVVDSAETRRYGIPESRRRLIDDPVQLAGEADMEALRLRLTARQARINQAPGTRGGNNRKRVRLRLDVPGYGPEDPDRLAARLAMRPARPVATFILAWNPARWQWPPEQYEQAVRTTARGGSWPEPWSVALRTGGISAGDRALLLRQHRERGIVASGTFASGLELDEHWDGSGRQTRYARVDWDTVVEPEDRLPVEVLKAGIPEVPWDRIQGSGVLVPSHAAEKLRDLWAQHVPGPLYPDELPAGQTFPEGTGKRVEVNRYERDTRARKISLAHWGPRCGVCDLDFGDRYGPLGQGFIHVHHIVDLSLAEPGYQVDPVNDLRPVCPNCHAMLHQRRPALSIGELKRHLQLHPDPRATVYRPRRIRGDRHRSCCHRDSHSHL